MNNEHIVTRVSMVVENAQELLDLLEKAQHQGAELRKTIYEIEEFQPIIRPEK
jgi:hypothetical protein